MYYTPGSLPETTSLGHSFLLQITPKGILPGVQVVLKGGKDWPMEDTRQETSALGGGTGWEAGNVPSRAFTKANP